METACEADVRARAAGRAHALACACPLKTRRGEFQGVLTIHFGRPRSPADRELRWAALYAPLAAHLIERYRTEAALRESEARLRAVIEEAPLA
jgi:GAF domain-containing protein